MRMSEEPRSVAASGTKLERALWRDAAALFDIPWKCGYPGRLERPLPWYEPNGLGGHQHTRWVSA